MRPPKKPNAARQPPQATTRLVGNLSADECDVRFEGVRQY